MIAPTVGPPARSRARGRPRPASPGPKRVAQLGAVDGDLGVPPPARECLVVAGARPPVGRGPDLAALLLLGPRGGHGLRTIVALDEWLLSAARARPDHAALVAEGRTLTFAELHERADGLARRLSVAPGTRVPTTRAPGLSFCELLHALPRRGAVLAPLEAGSPAAPPLPLGPAIGGPCTRNRSGQRAHVIHTSGTTGEPRAVELTSPTTRRARPLRRRTGTEEDDRWLCPCRCTTWRP